MAAKHLSLAEIQAATYEAPDVVEDYEWVLQHVAECRRCRRLVEHEQQTNPLVRLYKEDPEAFQSALVQWKARSK